MSNELDHLLMRLWDDYRVLNPEADRVRGLLQARGETVVDDHIALHTLDHPRLGIDATARSFERLGYHAAEEYLDPERGVRSRRYATEEPGRPQVFISELRLGEFSRGLRDIVNALLRQVDPQQVRDDDCVTGGLLWYPIMRDTRDRLLQESEYAAWVATFGFRAHHFAVSVNALGSIDSITALNTFLREHDVAIDTTDGPVRGSPAEGLEQSATKRNTVTVRFADGTRDVPGCRYEFTCRHATADGGIFPGFLGGAVTPIAPDPEPEPGPP